MVCLDGVPREFVASALVVFRAFIAEPDKVDLTDPAGVHAGLELVNPRFSLRDPPQPRPEVEAKYTSLLLTTARLRI